MSDNGKNGNGRRTYRTYRDVAGGDLAALIGPALADYHDRYGCFPPALAVHKTAVGKARLALDALEVALEVAGCGGVLLGECWLQVGENGHKRPQAVQVQGVSPTTPQTPGAGQETTQRSNDGPPSLLARVAAAHVDVTPERARQLALSFEGVTL